jgi:branched-subunit amino acid transport protein
MAGGKEMSNLDIWLTIIFLGVGTFLLRFSFIGLVGDRNLPEWMTRHLRYVPVAVMPGLIAPLTVWPQVTDGNPDPARLIAAAAALIIGSIFRSVLAAVFGGMAVLYLMLYLLG